ncbi:Ppx/GppA phosphatase family protein [Fodinibius salsisoli]|uniref:Ppx/GppA family phosphatase n=1 Tax=Fodinibius salsisoli TaxID=2820877 RepID=A0ABT3PQW8_9BACT|nr:Ppx/GppA phosphatase family protein [Fodinibius salsisoli]MCW9708254.1 Ppx/GppA family phosphatase [Fodinibius salsisoli]
MDCNTCTSRKMMKASIDIGTNTVLLLVAERRYRSLHVLEEQQRIPRLGRGVDKNKNLSKEAMNRVIHVLEEYKKLLAQQYPSILIPIVVATSAVRDANNRSAFLEKVKAEIGLTVQLLSGREEAEYTFKGAQSMLPKQYSTKPLLALDIGGGSTEMALGKGHEILDRYSFDMGCVRFTERFLGEPKATADQVGDCQEAVQKMLATYSFDITEETELVGVSGTVTSLAYMDQELEEYRNDKIDGYGLTLQTINQYIEWISDMSSDELLHRYPVVMEGRADIYLAGLLILKGIMDRYGFNIITASTGGIQHGAIIEAS